MILALQAKLGIGADTPGGAAQALLSDAAGSSLWRAITAADVANALRMDLATLQTIIGNLRLSRESPLVELVAAGGGTGAIGVNDGVMEVGGGGAPLITLASQLASFGRIPATLTGPNQVARKQYVDDTTTAWSVGG